MAPFPCIATNTSPPLGGGAKKIVIHNLKNDKKKNKSD